MINETFLELQRFKVLGALRPIYIKDILEALWSDDDKLQAWLENVIDQKEGIELLGESLGLEIGKLLLSESKEPYHFGLYANEEKYYDFKELSSKLKVNQKLMLSAPLNPYRFVSTLAVTCIQEDKLANHIKNTYGKTQSFAFFVAQTLMLARVIAGCRPLFSPHRSTPAKRAALLREERDRAHEVLDIIGGFLQENLKGIKKYFDPKFSDSCSRLATYLVSSPHTKERFAKIEALTDSPIDSLVPQYDLIKERLIQARTLMQEIQGCPPGRVHWQQYEDICIKILRFLFVPPFRDVLVQARSADRHERRDAILPNNQYSGFWRLIHDEFDSRHIVCEFKNGQTIKSKDSLNQLRIYLSKPTIGRFGLLFIRNRPNQVLIQSQRNAYEQSRIMILIIDDTKLQSLLKARSYLGHCDLLLEREKARFEINY